jgi:hypothetical protein
MGVASHCFEENAGKYAAFKLTMTKKQCNKVITFQKSYFTRYVG